MRAKVAASTAPTFAPPHTPQSKKMHDPRDSGSEREHHSLHSQPRRLWDVLPAAAKDWLGPDRAKGNSAVSEPASSAHLRGIFLPGLEKFTESAILSQKRERSLGSKSPPCS